MMDRDHFIILFREYLGSISSYLARRVNSNQVEDLASEIFEIAWRKREQCPAGFELPWLYRISSFVVANHRRKESRKPVILSFLDSDKAAPSAEDIFLEGAEISIAFSQLSSSDRQILSLFVFEDLSITEISVVLGLSANTTSQRLKRARARLAKNINDQLSES